MLAGVSCTVFKEHKRKPRNRLTLGIGPLRSSYTVTLTYSRIRASLYRAHRDFLFADQFRWHSTSWKPFPVILISRILCHMWWQSISLTYSPPVESDGTVNVWVFFLRGQWNMQVRWHRVWYFIWPKVVARIFDFQWGIAIDQWSFFSQFWFFEKKTRIKMGISAMERSVVAPFELNMGGTDNSWILNAECL